MAAKDGIRPLLRKGLWALSFLKKEQSRHPRKTFLEGTSGHPMGEPSFQVGLERGGRPVSMRTAGMAEVAGKHLATFPAKTSRLIFLQPLSRTSQRETSTRDAKPSILSPQNGIREKCAKLR